MPVWAGKEMHCISPPIETTVPLDSPRTLIKGQRTPRVCVRRTPGAWRALASGFGPPAELAERSHSGQGDGLGQS